MSGYQDEENKALEDIRRWDEESVVYFSNRRKPLRERNIVKAFLRICGIEFTDDEVKSCAEDPPDVLFREARFEVLELLDEDRKRHDEYKERAEKSERATCLADLLKAPPNSTALEFSDLLRVIETAIDDKYRRYKNRKDRIVDFTGLDALVYVNLKRHHLNPQTQGNRPSEFLTKVQKHGWGSVCFLQGFCAGVIFSKADAPAFINDLGADIKLAKTRDVFED
jgi:hypothetical protein